ncbi:MAG TPA: hypothetical protein DF480_03065 [Clostridiales bacterium]|jgi:phenylacetate-coenzyme A ligase PaaK-like adenylate-forming protein|nr:hypothetical protein [Clostridiales bacterium]
MAFALQKERDRILVPIDTIVSYAEVLTAEDKERFRTGFGARVIEIYQTSEGQMGSACKCVNLHINEDLVCVELYVDQGNPVTEPGRPAARMIVTNLINRAQPLTRYELNDLIVLGEPCPCGSAFRVIGRHGHALRILIDGPSTPEAQKKSGTLFSRGSRRNCRASTSKTSRCP